MPVCTCSVEACVGKCDVGVVALKHLPELHLLQLGLEEANNHQQKNHINAFCWHNLKVPLSDNIFGNICIMWLLSRSKAMHIQIKLNDMTFPSSKQ